MANSTNSNLADPFGVAVDITGNVYVVDPGTSTGGYLNGAVYKFAPNGGSYSQTTVVSTGLDLPFGVAVGNNGNVYVANDGGNDVLQYTPNGSGGYTELPNVGNGLSRPIGVAVDGSGNVFIADNVGVVEVSQSVNFGQVAVGSAGTANQQTLTYTFQNSATLTAVNVLTRGATGKDYTSGTGTTCAVGHAYVATDTCNVQVDLAPAKPGARMGAVQLVDSSGVLIATYLRAIGTGPLGVFQPGTGSMLNTGSLTLNEPFGVAVDGAGDVYIADYKNNHVVVVAAGGATSVLNVGTPGGVGLNGPVGIAVDGAGNIYIADSNNNRVVEVTAAGVVTVLNTGSLTLSLPFGVAVDGIGNVYISDTNHNRVVEATPGGLASVVSTGTLTLNFPISAALDGAGDIYIVDGNNNRVVEVTAAGLASVLSTGSLTLAGPRGIALDGAGDVYIADNSNQRIVQVTAAGVASVLSTGSQSLNGPYGVAVDGAGDVYITVFGKVVEVNQGQTAALSFPSTGTGDSSAQQTVSMQNIGNLALDFTSLDTTTTGQTTSSFNLNGAGTTCLTTTPLTPGSTCGLGVEFEPLVAGALTGTVNIADNSLNAVSPNNVQQFSVSGTGVGYAASIALAETPGTTVVSGTAITVTATLTGANGTPTGSITYTLDGTLQPAVTLSSGGVAQFTLPTTLAVGTHSVVVSYAGDANYTDTTPSQSINLTVTVPPNFTLAASSTSLNITQGQTAIDTLTLNSVGGYSGTVALSCQNLPAHAFCAFGPNRVQLSANGQPLYVGLTIQTSVQTARMEALPAPTQSPLNPVIPALAFWWPGSLAGLAAIGRKRKLSKTQHRWLQLCLLLVMTGVFAAGLAGCAGGSIGANATPAGTSTVTVLATGTSSGTTVIKQTVVLTLTVAQ